MPAKIDNVSDLVASLKTRFPDNDNFILEWTDEYFHILGKLAPADLRQVAHDTFKLWKYKRPPKPADFAAHIRRSVSPVPVGEQERLRAALIQGIHMGRLTPTEAQQVWSDCDLPGFVADKPTEAA